MTEDNNSAINKLVRLRDTASLHGDELLQAIFAVIEDKSLANSGCYDAAAAVFEEQPIVMAAIYRETVRQIAASSAQDYRKEPGTALLRSCAATMGANFEHYWQMFDVLAVWQAEFGPELYSQLITGYELQLGKVYQHMLAHSSNPAIAAAYYRRKYGGTVFAPHVETLIAGQGEG